MIRTVVVDDDFRVAAIHAAYVEKVPGYDVVGQAHSAQALFNTIGPLQPDLLLLDLYLPDHNGLDVLKRLRQPGPRELDLDVIVITAAHDVASVRTAMQCGALHYLLKPFGFPALREKLVAYHAMRRQLEAARHTDQSSVDRLYAALAGHCGATSSRARANHTLDAVEAVLADAGGDLSAADVATSLGVSRATAQRYLTQLEEVGRVTMTLRYGTAGRPEHRYRSIAARAAAPG